MKRSGFTILELIAVIGIIAVIGTAVVGAFSGMMKGVSQRNAADSVRRALNLARQEACVDGNDVYFYAVDVNRYAIVRKAGTISDTDTDLHDVRISTNRVIRNVSITGGKWIVDEYADLEGTIEAFVVDESQSDSELINVFKDYAGSMVFDMVDGVYADVAWSPVPDDKLDAWVFGIKNPEGSTVVTTSFKKGHDYGWVTHPILGLPQGYVFKDSYETASGAFKSKNDVYVHFNADGTLDSAKTITLQRTDNGTEIVIEIEASGKITEKTTAPEGEGS